MEMSDHFHASTALPPGQAPGPISGGQAGPKADINGFHKIEKPLPLPGIEL
jgi:hypothetical protein